MTSLCAAQWTRDRIHLAILADAVNGGIDLFEIGGTFIGSSTPPNGPPVPLAAMHELDDSHLFCVQGGGRPLAHIVHLPSLKVVTRLHVPKPCYASAKSNDGSLLAMGADDGTVFVWRIDDGRLLSTWRPHFQSISCLCFAAGDALLLVASKDSRISAWSMIDVLADRSIASLHEGWADESREVDQKIVPLYEIADHRLIITQLIVAGSVDGRIYSASLDRTVRVWNLVDGSHVVTFHLPAPVSAIACDVAQSFFLAGCSDGSIYRTRLHHTASTIARELSASEEFNARRACLQLRAPTHDGSAVNSIQLVCDSSMALVTECSKGECAVYDVPSGQLVRILSNPKDKRNHYDKCLVWIDYNKLEESLTGEPNASFSGTKRFSNLAKRTANDEEDVLHFVEETPLETMLGEQPAISPDEAWRWKKMCIQLYRGLAG